MSDVSAILAEFDAGRGLYDDLAPKLEGLILELLGEHQLPVHSITSRVKHRDSLARKITGSGQEYPNLAAITDVLGARVVTFFPSDVDRVAQVIEDGFEVDYDRSIDKRQQLAPDTFGYLSLHNIARLAPARLQLLEYKRFSACTFEIQITNYIEAGPIGAPHEVPAEIARRVLQAFHDVTA